MIDGNPNIINIWCVSLFLWRTVFSRIRSVRRGAHNHRRWPPRPGDHCIQFLNKLIALSSYLREKFSCCHDRQQQFICNMVNNHYACWANLDIRHFIKLLPQATTIHMQPPAAKDLFWPIRPEKKRNSLFQLAVIKKAETDL